MYMQNGQPVAYASRRNSVRPNREGAVGHCIRVRTFRVLYLYGRGAMNVETDHQPL